MADQEERTALVVGAGLVGTLAAAMLASRGWTVTLLEGRTDPRQGTHAERSRSINLALSPRGIEALRSVSDELVARVLEDGIEMRGRMLHKVAHKGKGKGRVDKEAQDYGRYEEEGECIRSISRTALGIHLLDHVDGLPKSGRGSVTTRFETRLSGMDLRKDQGVDVVLEAKGAEPEKRHFDFVLGGDGAYSRVRQEMMRGSRIRCVPCSLAPPSVPPRARLAPLLTLLPPPRAQLRLPPVLRAPLVPRALDPGRPGRLVPPRAQLPAHLAPRRVHAHRARQPGASHARSPRLLPHVHVRRADVVEAHCAQDKSFTLTLFAHDSTFSTIDAELARRADKGAKADDEHPVVDLFRREFPDALELMGDEALVRYWRENPKDGLITVEVRSSLSLSLALSLFISLGGRSSLLTFSSFAVLAVPLPGQGAHHRRRRARHGPLLRCARSLSPSSSFPLARH